METLSRSCSTPTKLGVIINYALVLVFTYVHVQKGVLATLLEVRVVILILKYRFGGQCRLESGHSNAFKPFCEDGCWKVTL